MTDGAKQTALVTGAARGIGRAAALSLAEAGCDLALNDLEDSPDLRATMADCAALGVACLADVFDVADIAGHEAALNRIEARLGPLSTLVNNAGVGAMSRGDPLDVTPESYDRCMGINARAGFFLAQAFARRAIARRDLRYRSIIAVTSANADAVAESRAEYCVSKAAAAMAARSLAVRLGREGIHVYDVRPGLIDTDLTAPVIADYRSRAADGLTVLPRVGDPAEVGAVIAQLATGALPYTTGQVIHVDGGLLVPRF